MAPKGPYKLCTVNKVPARAKVLIGRVVEDVRDSYTIEYVANAERVYFLTLFGVTRMWKGEDRASWVVG
jgi:hypothetical protein